MARCFTVLFISMLLLGCTEGDMRDLHRFVKEAHKDRKPRVEPLPRIRPYESYSYTATNLTDPFSRGNLLKRKPTTPGSGLSPDLDRRKEPLEQYPLDSLRMVGTLSRGAASWAVIHAPDGTIHRAGTGNYVGQNFGKIMTIADEKLDIKEIVQGPGGNWVERDTTIAIVK
jgi:type IV pilus assembly protein PilP